MKKLFLFLLTVSIALAQGPSEILIEQLSIIYAIAGAMIMLMVVLAAAAYVIGNFFGAETRAKATVWAQGMLVAAGISVMAIVMMNFIVPGILQGGSQGDIEVVTLADQLRQLGQTVLASLIVLLVVLSAVAYVVGQVTGAETRAKATVWATNLLTGAIIASVIYALLFMLLTNFRGLLAGTPVGQYADVIIIVAFFVSFFILITYLLSKVFKIPEWEAYLSVEMSNLISSFFIVVFVVGLFAAGTAVSLMFGADPSPPKAAIAYLRNDVIESVLQGLIDVYKIQACTSILNTISRRIGEFVLTSTYKVFPGIDTFVNITSMLAMGLVSVYASLSVQVALLYLVDQTMVNFILPAGLILRFFPPTRDAGAFLISLAFGFQIIFPTTYLLNGMIFNEIGATVYESSAATFVIQDVCGPFKYGLYGVVINPSVNPVFSFFPGGQAAGTILAQIFSEGLLNLMTMGQFTVFMEQISKLSLLSLFLPALSMLVTIAFINAMTKFIVGKM
ncbi:hypothetical protein JXA56_02210 [Candidatus Micrarchaeota archaeon]|nr:hypothetical protein [Candidatus Micrarchaeota archaeon]